ncbi:hypothetical protein [Prosthecobacter sp.]|uniref:hypothetical protein n=1 Tax=Prosthecobacter sp. TaxID=1965333 RepID=UPI003784B2AA
MDDEIENDLLHGGLVCHDTGQIGAVADLDGNLLPHGFLQHGGLAINNLTEMQRSRLHVFAPVEGHKLRGNARSTLRREDELLKSGSRQRARASATLIELSYFQMALNHSQVIVKKVSHRIRETPHGFQPLVPAQLVLQLFAVVLLKPEPVADVFETRGHFQQLGVQAQIAVCGLILSNVPG